MKLCLLPTGDAWRFDAAEKRWDQVGHPHEDKTRFVDPRPPPPWRRRDPLNAHTRLLLRVCHTACLGSHDDVVVFGGSSNMRVLLDTVGDGGEGRWPPWCFFI